MPGLLKGQGGVCTRWYYQAVSGPKCAIYILSDIFDYMHERKRQRDATISRGADLLERSKVLRAANAARRNLGKESVPFAAPGDFPAGGSLEEMAAWNASVSELLTRAEEDLKQAEQNERREDLRLRIATVGSGRAAETVRRRAEDDARRLELSRWPSDSVSSKSPTHKIDRSGEIADLVNRFPAGASSEERASIEERMVPLVHASDAEFGSAVVGVKAEIQRIERLIADRAHTARRAEGLIRTLEGLEGPEVDASRNLLRRVIAGETPLLQPDVAKVAEVRDKAEADHARRFVATGITNAFRECGFEVGVGFASDVVAGGETYIASRSSAEHAVGVRMRDGEFDLRVVRGEGAPDARLDADAEEEFCNDLVPVRAALRRRGVDLELVSQIPPGEEPMAVVSEAREALHTHTRAARLDRPRHHSRP